MICNECHKDKPGPCMDAMPVAEVQRLCRAWKCPACSRTPEQIQHDLVAANPALPMHKRAHDWAAVQQTQGGEHA